MKILMVTMRMGIGGAETHIHELCRELIKRGHSVTLASAGGVYADMLVSEGVEHITLPLDSKSPFAIKKNYTTLYRTISQGNFDIVHAHARIPAFICGLVRHRLAFRFVTTAHLDFSLNPIWKLLSKWGDRTMAVSNDIVDYLVDGYGCSRDKINVTINGIDTEKNSDKIEYDDILSEFSLEKENRTRLVYMSRLDADRADPAYRIVNISYDLNEKFPNLDIIIVGGGTEFDKISSIAENVNSKVGRKLITITDSRSDTNKFMSLADVFVGVSRSALEAMSASKPVILAGNQGSTGILDENSLSSAMETNFCCRGYEQADEKKLFDDISALLSLSDEDRREKGLWCKSVIDRYYTAERMTDDYIEFYNSALSSPVPYYGHCDVLLSGYYGFGNIGDETLLSVISNELATNHLNVHIAALTRHPKADTVSKGIKCINRFNVFKIISELGHAKLFISGGGTLFQDATSSRSLRYYAGVISLAEKLGTKVYIYANGIGPINSEKNRILTAKCVSKADMVSVRDPDSKAELISLGVDESKITVTADPAFLVTPHSGDRLKHIMSSYGFTENEKFFCVSVRRCEGKLSSIIDEESLVSEVTSACEEIANKYSCTPVIIPMQSENDNEICAKINSRLTDKNIDSKLIAPTSAEELIGILSKAEFAIGMRLHMLIFGARAGIPVIGISYDPKIDSVMKRLELPYTIPVTELKASDITEAAEHIVSSRDEICAAVEVRSAEMSSLCRDDITLAVKMMK